MFKTISLMLTKNLHSIKQLFLIGLFTFLNSNFLLAQCGGYFILVSDNYNGTKTQAFSVDLSTGGLTAISNEFPGYLTALAVNPTSSNLFLADPPDQPGLIAPIFLGTPYITSLTNTNVNIGGPRLCGDLTGEYLYSVTSTVPFNSNTTFKIRRSNLNTFQEEEALVTDMNGVAIYNNSDGDLHMSSEGYLFVLDGPGKLVRVDLTTWDSNTNTVKATSLGTFKPTLFDQYFTIAQDPSGNFIATGSDKRIYRFDLATKKADIIAQLNYDGTGFPELTSIATDAASCIYPVYHSVSGHVFIDWNQNGSKQTGENGTGVTLYAKIIAGTGTNAKVFAVVAVDPVTGYYKFNTAIPNSTYRVKFSTNSDLTDTTSIVPSGWFNTSNVSLEKTVNNADVNNVDFGLYNVALAVDALSFEAQLHKNTVQLEWVAKNETNTSHFVVERSRDGVTFESIGVVKAKGTTTGLSYYDFTDNNPNLGSNYYRLQLIDNNLTTTNSKVITVYYNPTGSGFISVSPNPASEYINIKMEGAKSGIYNVGIYNFNGQLIYHSNPFYASGDVNWKLDLSTLQNGWYFVKIYSEESELILAEKISVYK